MSGVYRFRIHWGYWMLYGPYAFQHAYHSWDGYLTIEPGSIVSCHLIEFNGSCGPGRESLISLDEARWHWSPANANNRLGGILCEVTGGPAARVILCTRTVQYEFTLEELVRRKVIRVHVGPRYSNVDVVVVLDGHDPELDQDDDLSAMTATDGAFRTLVRAPQAGEPLHRWFRTDWLWIEPESATDLTLPVPQWSRGVAPLPAGRCLRTVIRCVAAWPVSEGETFEGILARGAARNVQFPLQVRTEKTIPYELWLGDHRVGAGDQFFAYMGNVPLMEEITVKIPADLFGRTTPTLRVVNGSTEAHMLIGRVYLEETMESGCELTCPRWVRAGIPFDILIVCQSEQQNPQFRAPRFVRLLSPFPRCLPAGETRITLSIDVAAADILLSVSSDSFEVTARIEQVVTVEPEPYPMVVGLEDKVLPANSPGHREEVIGHLATTQLGDLYIFRHGSTIESASRLARLCREHGVYCLVSQSMGFARARAIQSEAGPYYLGYQWTEHDGPLWGYIQAPLPERDPELPSTMKTAHDAYITYVRTLVSRVHEEGPDMEAWLMVSAIGHSLGYAAGMDCCFAQFNKTHNVVLLADARGAARAYDRPFWGTYQAEGAHINPEGSHHLRMWWLSLYLAFVSGASFANDEECLYRTWHEGIYARGDRMPRMRRRIMREFNRYVKTHPRRGSIEVRQAVLIGRYACDVADGVATADDHGAEMPPMVWRNFGEWTHAWRPSQAEYGLRYLDVFLPGVWLQTLEQSADSLRRWYSGTPYGEIDLVPVDARQKALDEYHLLMMLGWNTADEDQYGNLRSYVERGGRLFMSVPHLSSNEGRAFLWDGLDPLNLIRDGEFSDLFGVQVVGRGPRLERIVAQRTAAENPLGEYSESATFFALPAAPPHHDPVDLAEVKLAGAEVLATDTGSGKPVLTRARVGRGEAYLLCTYAYPGNSWLVPFVTAAIRGLAQTTPALVSLDGGSEDIYYSVRVSGDSYRVFLLNTDWTTEANEKRCRLRLGAHRIPVSVKEGRLAEVVWMGRLAVLAEDPRVYVARIACTQQHEYVVEVHGYGDVELQVTAVGGDDCSCLEATHSGRPVVTRRGPDWTTVRFDFGASSTGELRVRLPSADTGDAG